MAVAISVHGNQRGKGTFDVLFFVDERLFFQQLLELKTDGYPDFTRPDSGGGMEV